jgi:hypothetical protein
LHDSESTRWVRAAGLAAAIWIVWASFMPSVLTWNGLASVTLGFYWAGLAFSWMGLAVSAALWVRFPQTRSITELIDDIDGEPVRAIAAPIPRAVILN